MPWWWNGRHAGLKILWEQSRAGSSPARGTNLRAQFIDNQCLALFFCVLRFASCVLHNQSIHRYDIYYARRNTHHYFQKYPPQYFVALKTFHNLADYEKGDRKG
jgi:hypothetical protein